MCNNLLKILNHKKCKNKNNEYLSFDGFLIFCYCHLILFMKTYLFLIFSFLISETANWCIINADIELAYKYK